MNLHKSDDFIADLERQFEWYVKNAEWEVAERYLAAVEASCHLLQKHPAVGPRTGFTNRRLRAWPFFIVRRQFNQHLLFYEISGSEIVMRRALATLSIPKSAPDTSPGPNRPCP